MKKKNKQTFTMISQLLALMSWYWKTVFYCITSSFIHFLRVLGGWPALVSFYPLRRSPLWALAMINVHQKKNKKTWALLNEKCTKIKKKRLKSKIWTNLEKKKKKKRIKPTHRGWTATKNVLITTYNQTEKSSSGWIHFSSPHRDSVLEGETTLGVPLNNARQQFVDQ